MSLSVLDYLHQGGYAAWATSRKRDKTEPDSHNYEPDESEVWRTHQAQRHFKDRGRSENGSTARNPSIMRGVMINVPGSVIIDPSPRD